MTENATDKDEYFAMLWKWFEKRGAIDRYDWSDGKSAEDFMVMLDEHEAALLHSQGGKAEPDAWLVGWHSANGDAGTSVYTTEDEARRAAKNMEAYRSSETMTDVLPLYAAPLPSPPESNKEWRCFHCDEVFTDAKAAANHFGVDHVGDETLCQMAQVDGGIARVIADLSEELQRHRSEDNDSYREFYALGANHARALIAEEQKGYDRGVADGRAAALSREEGSAA